MTTELARVVPRRLFVGDELAEGAMDAYEIQRERAENDTLLNLHRFAELSNLRQELEHAVWSREQKQQEQIAAQDEHAFETAERGVLQDVAARDEHAMLDADDALTPEQSPPPAQPLSRIDLRAQDSVELERVEMILPRCADDACWLEESPDSCACLRDHLQVIFALTRLLERTRQGLLDVQDELELARHDPETSAERQRTLETQRELCARLKSAKEKLLSAYAVNGELQVQEELQVERAIREERIAGDRRLELALAAAYGQNAMLQIEEEQNIARVTQYERGLAAERLNSASRAAYAQISRLRLEVSNLTSALEAERVQGAQRLERSLATQKRELESEFHRKAQAAAHQRADSWAHNDRRTQAAARRGVSRQQMVDTDLRAIASQQAID